jgi:hypothetical protein
MPNKFSCMPVFVYSQQVELRSFREVRAVKIVKRCVPEIFFF